MSGIFCECSDFVRQRSVFVRQRHFNYSLNFCFNTRTLLTEKLKNLFHFPHKMYISNH